MKTRKSTYQAKIYKGDYFVIKGLKKFIEDQLKQYVTEGVKVCDVGCGEQPWKNFIESLGAEYIGIDLQQNSQNTVHVLADICHIALPDESFDIVLCTEVLEHIQDIKAALKELARLTKADGKMIITLPFFYPLHEEPYDYLRITPHQVLKLAEQLNLQVKELSTSGNELEAIATIWDNLWNRSLLNKPNLFKKILAVFLRVILNLPILCSSYIFQKYFPKKSYLNTLFVLYR